MHQKNNILVLSQYIWPNMVLLLETDFSFSNNEIEGS